MFKTPRYTVNMQKSKIPSFFYIEILVQTIVNANQAKMIIWMQNIQVMNIFYSNIFFTLSPQVLHVLLE